MENRIEAYINASFQRIRSMRETERSIVWLASDTTGRLVVIKRIHAVGLPFLQLKDLAHPLYPEILFVGEGEGETWLVEEFVSGRTLQEELDTGKHFSSQEARAIALALLDGMAAFHGIGIVHRDIKPSNIILQNAVHARLIDFDAARRIQAGADGDTERLGTVGYAPPEQFGFGQTDARSDIYALGMTIRAILREEREAGLGKILDKCTELNPRDRYASAEDMRKALLRCHGRAWWKTAGAAVLATALFAAGIAAQSPQEKKEEPSVEAVQQEAQQKKTEEELSEKTPASASAYSELPGTVMPEAPPAPQPEPERPASEQGGRLSSIESSRRWKRLEDGQKKQPVRELSEGEFTVDVLVDDPLNLKNGEIIMLPKSAWEPWQQGEYDPFSIIFPQSWSIGLRLTNYSGETIHAPTLVYFWVNEEEHHQTLPDLENGAETIVYIPVGGGHRRLYKEVPYTVRMSFQSARPKMAWYKSIDFFLYDSSPYDIK